jgi:hypothetical protein
VATLATSAPVREGGFRRLWRVLRQLFHEVIGAVFAVLALAWANAALRSWARAVPRWLVVTAVFVAAAMLFFSWTSFRRARRLG